MRFTSPNSNSFALKHGAAKVGYTHIVRLDIGMKDIGTHIASALAFVLHILWTSLYNLYKLDATCI